MKPLALIITCLMIAGCASGRNFCPPLQPGHRIVIAARMDAINPAGGGIVDCIVEPALP